VVGSGNSANSIRNVQRTAVGGQSNHQNMQYFESRERLQAPGIAASFSSVSGSPCERVPLGAGGSFPGFGALFQIPLESERCWQERQALMLHNMGYRQAAVVTLVSGNPAEALRANPTHYSEYGYRRPARYHRVAKKARRNCAC
jgi:hypothetical protein